VHVKICGVRARADLAAAARCGASYAGLVFFPPSPRNISIDDAKWMLDKADIDGLTLVALTVDAEDSELEEIVASLPVGLLQLHGRESPERVAEIRRRFHLPVMKAVGVADEGDLAAIDDYEAVADQILVDARPPKDAQLPGGNGLTFDWRLIAGRSWSRPWMLAGGLGPDNVAEAVRLTGAEQVDVSSGVERAPGIKDADRIEAFIAAARAASAAAA
jgi:phosphoribosylanthranilate isomerase